MHKNSQTTDRKISLKHGVYTVLAVVVFGGVLLTSSIGFGLELKKKVQNVAELDSLKKEKLKLEIELLKKNNYR